MSNAKPRLMSIDAFAKTVEDARIRTTSGGIITLICVLIVLVLIRNEYNDYTTIISRPELVVDRDINKPLDINLDISFWNMPCDILSLDIMDETGDVQLDILRAGFKKFRITKDANGNPDDEILDEESVPVNSDVSIEILAKGLKEGENGECGSCYGALPQDKKQYCCNDCETVKLAYAEAGWGFFDGENIQQCEKEGYVKRLKERVAAKEGCRIMGTTRINRISGSMDFAPGASVNSKGRHVHDLSLYNKEGTSFNFDHVINSLTFGEVPKGAEGSESTHSLDRFGMKVNNRDHVFSYYLKVVATRFEFLSESKKSLDTNQFSVITHNRPLKGGKDEDHKNTVHARGGFPGVIFHFDISPLKIINKEQYAKTWSGFVLGVISSIAGVLMVGTLLDKSVYAAEQAIKSKKDL
ncbi:endoplasmic reticulum vesicle transporter-domain-containing protein [Scheffersomyces xylosifermentans]|uniref:endoplasmic reticulum vesicle transporter-domain-containing protein n=1 Tax=Scheffersomyces xylosifermentans TaxID=1304137 RepID=UPI00315CDD9E